jgi:hypothetical protein
MATDGRNSWRVVATTATAWVWVASGGSGWNRRVSVACRRTSTGVSVRLRRLAA